MYWTVWRDSGHTGAPIMSPSPTSRALPYGALVLTSALWATSSVTARGLLDTLAPAWLSALRWTVVLLALAPVAWRDRRAIADAFRRHFGSLALFALVGFAPQTWLVYVGLAGSSAINLSLLNSAIPVLIVAVAALLHRRKPGALELAGIAVSLAGVLVIVARGRPETFAALAVNGHDLLMLVGMGVWAWYTVRLARRDDALPFPSFMFAAGLIGLALIAPAVAWEAATQRIALPGAGAWAGVVYLGVLPTIAAMTLLAYGIRRVGPVQAGLFTHLVPVFAALLATIFLGETLHVFHAAGFALVAGGAILGCLRPERDATDPSLPLAAGAAPSSRTAGRSATAA